MNKKKIVVFTGAGISAESGISTFRDCKDGLWENFKIEDVATPEGWRKDRAKVLEFYNARRRELPNVEPNDAHLVLATLEEEYDVTIVTQNVDDLHERGGSSNILHLHGELTKARSSYLNGNPITDRLGMTCKPLDIGYNDINIGDKCEEYGAQLRPHIVWFGEYPFGVLKANEAFKNADLIIIVGTSMSIGYTMSFFGACKRETPIYYIDPSPSKSIELDYPELDITYVEKGAVEGVSDLVKTLMLQAIGDDKNDKD
jgi:NAD-dependent deacetylase